MTWWLPTSIVIILEALHIVDQQEVWNVINGSSSLSTCESSGVYIYILMWKLMRQNIEKVIDLLSLNIQKVVHKYILMWKLMWQEVQQSGGSYEVS